MAVLMKGTDVAAGMNDALLDGVKQLKSNGVEPTLAIIRVGARGSDVAYERGAMKRCSSLGIAVRVIELTEDTWQPEFNFEFWRVNDDPSVHGILLLRPLPHHLSDSFARRVIDPRKDVDGMSFINAARVFAGDMEGDTPPFAPCTPCAVMEMLSHYNVGLDGKRAVIVGRSMVSGRPLSMLMLAANSTVTVCHSRTVDLPSVCRNADILVSAAGKAGFIGPDYVTGNTTVVDVGINVGMDGKIRGDVDFDAVSPLVSAISPVPGGVGAVTTSILAKHVLDAAHMLSTSASKEA